MAAAITRGEPRNVFLRRMSIADMFSTYSPSGAGEDVRETSVLFRYGTLPEDPNQRNWFYAMQSLLEGAPVNWGYDSTAKAGCHKIRRCMRLCAYAARVSDDPTIVLAAGRLLATAAKLRHPYYVKLSRTRHWQYLGTDVGLPGTNWGFTSEGQPMERVKRHRGMKLEAILPALRTGGVREMDKDVKTALKLTFGLVEDEQRPETYNCTVEDVVLAYIAHRRHTKKAAAA